MFGQAFVIPLLLGNTQPEPDGYLIIRNIRDIYYELEPATATHAKAADALLVSRPKIAKLHNVLAVSAYRRSISFIKMSWPPVAISAPNCAPGAECEQATRVFVPRLQAKFKNDASIGVRSLSPTLSSRAIFAGQMSVWEASEYLALGCHLLRILDLKHIDTGPERRRAGTQLRELRKIAKIDEPHPCTEN